MTTRTELSAAEAYEHGHTALMRAALDGDSETVKALIHQGADLNQRDDNGRTALMFAVINMHYETMKVLLEYGALMAAAMVGDLTMVQALLDKGADVHARLRETTESAVTFAESHGHAEIARLLLQLD